MNTLFTILLILLILQLVICIANGFFSRKNHVSYWDGFFEGLFWWSIFYDNDWDDTDWD